MYVCSKRRYATSVDAMLALQRIQGQRDIDSEDKYERSWYPCGDHFHVTSWPGDSNETPVS